MFDEMVSAAQRAGGAVAVGAWARVETAACARRLMAMVAVLDAAHAADGSAEREQWYLDNWGAVSAEIGAAQQITTAAASNQLLVATALRDHLPQVAARFAEGCGSYRLMSTIVWRTAQIKDPAAMAAVDGALSAALRDWEPTSEAKTVAAIDHWVHAFDPHALRRTQTQARSREVHVNLKEGEGLASLWGSLFAPDAKALDQRLDAFARTVCDGDGRTLEQRRADALGALATGGDRLACRCGQADCQAAGVASSSTVVYVIAHQDTLDDQGGDALAQDAALDGEGPVGVSDKPLREQTLTEALTNPVPGGFAATRAGAVMGGAFLPGPVLRRAALHAAVRKVFHPGAALPERGYRPSRRLADFVRCRDLTCRFPGCDVPAQECDLDHTIAYPVGPTQASNIKCLCRIHHLLKTFWGGWSDRQLPDGTVYWRSPSGARFTTRPGSRLMFPELCAPTAPVTVTAARPECATGLNMPRRARTRAEARRQRIDDERRLNQRAVAAMRSAPPHGDDERSHRRPASMTRSTAAPSSSEGSRSTSASKSQS